MKVSHVEPRRMNGGLLGDPQAPIVLELEKGFGCDGFLKSCHKGK